MSTSKNNSTLNLNESNMPLLSEEDKPEKTGETPEKESVNLEMELQEKEDSGNEKNLEKKKKKATSNGGPKRPSYIDVISHGMNLQNRDCKSINSDIDIGFDDVLAEPLSSHGFDCIWKLSFVIFSQTKTFLYRLLSAIIAIPASIIWGLIFAIITVLYVWVLAPLLKIFDFIVSILRKVLLGLMRFTIEPVSASVGHIFSQVSIHSRRHDLVEKP
ncbi:caveolin-1-like [Lepeophtheirus salmonis]|uniref:caveolin-1-like n=1 Tax=Lepeophtheirus salmonis TaxID=72036 RepID=UPI001AEA4B92|nr:caveolin-3-like [Lepeophtheirus salmonis]XP_040565749.1 caveolin-3-like [Lepeophtheirus salmonis]